MGSCKDDMKKTDVKDLTKKDDGVFGRFSSKRKKIASEDAPKTFADMVEKAEESLQKMLTTKESELKNEKGREDYNRKALALLEIAQFHLDSIIDVCSEYGDLK